MSGFPDPSLPSTVTDTPLESNSVHSRQFKEDDSVTLPTSQSTSNAAVEKPVKENLTHTKLSEKARKLDIEPVKTVEIPQYGKQERIEFDPEEVKNEKRKDEVPVVTQESNELKELSDEEEDEDEDESLDLSDLSLPDGGEKYAPSFIPSQKKPSHHEKEDVAVVRKDSEISSGPSKPVAVLDATKSVTEEISEDIPESVALEGDETLNDVPAHDERKESLPSSGELVADQPKMLDVDNDVHEKDEKEEDLKEVLTKDKAEIPAQKMKEERTPSVSVDGFLCLLQVVDADVEVSFSPEALYHSPRCSSDMREEIVG